MSGELQKNTSNTSALSQIRAGSELSKSEFQSEPYTAAITRKRPTALVFLIDQSGSMKGAVKGQAQSKAAFAAEILNLTLQELLNLATKGEGIRNYIDVACIAYGAEEQESQFLIGEGFLMLSELAGKILRKETLTETKNVRGKLLTQSKEVPIWIEPLARSLTPMGHAFDRAFALLEQWTKTHPDSYPPSVINISDGAPTDAEDAQMLQKANRLKALHTQNGNVLLFNAHLDGEDRESLLFPSSREEVGESRYARLMYNMSSELPPALHRQAALAKGRDLDEDSHFVAMTYRAGASEFIKLMEVGTKSQMNHIRPND